jgi:FkbH-like protein
LQALTHQILRVCGTSNLLPGAAAWRPLEAKATLAFGEYGDWPQALLAGADDPVLWVLILEDLIGPDRVEGLDAEAMDALLNPILDPLRARFEGRGSATALVAWSAWRPDAIVRASRRPTAWQRLARRLETALYALAAQYPGLHLIALDEVFAIEGLRGAFDARNLYAARCRLSRRGLGELAGAVACVLDRLAQPAKKVLVLDCDGVLWGDVLGEVGVGRIVLGGDGLGKAFADLQAAALRLARRGVILVLASKNNEAEVWAAFDQHPEMILSRKDIAAWRINWREKADNLAELARDLDLGLDSFVFFDDNPLEREKMRAAQAQVSTPELPADVTLWPALLDSFDLFAKAEVTAEDTAKTVQYQNRAAFSAERSRAVNETAFLASLEMKPRAEPLGPANLARADQLIHKTNQYNLRAERHSAAALAALAAAPETTAFLTRLSDRFGDHGAVGLTIARRSGTHAFLDTFLMSCRVLGRQLEVWMLADLAARLKSLRVVWLWAEFRDSGRNAVASDFLDAHGFSSWPDAATAPTLPDDLAALAGDGRLYRVALADLALPHLEVFDDPARAPASYPERRAPAAVS